MSNSYFQFKQFRVEQGRCAMKITTDACIQGAWTPLHGDVRRILDVGTGTGLLALMLAQRTTEALIDAIELDAEAATQAKENIAASVWKDRVNIIAGDAREHAYAGSYDLIIVNPPFFNDSLHGPDKNRNLARHTLCLSYADLASILHAGLSANGYASVLLPAEEYVLWTAHAQSTGLHEYGKLVVRHTAGAEVKRVVGLFSKNIVSEYTEQTLTIRSEGQYYSEDFVTLLSPFYLAL